jgi:hypothetical protein
MRLTLPIMAFAMLAPAPASACIICHSPTSLGVRHLLLEHDLLYNAAAVIAPIPLLLLVIMLVAREPIREGGA